MDLGPYVVSDWYYQTAYQVGFQAHLNLQSIQRPAAGDNILVNGTNKNAKGGGELGRVGPLVPGKRYRLRLLNAGVDNQIRVSLDHHRLEVVTTDMVPIKRRPSCALDLRKADHGPAFVTDWLLVGVGQRYDVVFTANQTADHYWFRAEVAGECSSHNDFYGRSIFSYDGAPSSPAEPQSTAAPAPDACTVDGPLEPWVPNTVSSEAFVQQVASLQVDVNQEQVATNGQNIVVWGVNMTGIDVEWDRPTLDYLKKGRSDWPSVYNLIEIPTQNTVRLPCGLGS